MIEEDIIETIKQANKPLSSFQINKRLGYKYTAQQIGNKCSCIDEIEERGETIKGILWGIKDDC